MVYGLTRLKRIKVSSVVYFLDLPRFNKNFQSFKVNRALWTRALLYRDPAQLFNLDRRKLSLIPSVDFCHRFQILDSKSIPRLPH